MIQSLRSFLLQTYPEYIEVVPNHWLEQEPPKYDVQLTISIFLLVICVSGNVSQLLVIVAFMRYEK